MSWSAVAIGGASVVSGLLGSQAAGDAANVQADASRAGISETARQFDITQENLAPFQEAGVEALGQQQALLGLGTPEEQEQAFAAFSDSPGQQFLRDQQEKALLRNSAAVGGLGGGNVLTALQDQAFGRAQTDYGNQFNRLGSLTGGGQTAVTDLGQFGAQAAGTTANLQSAAGAAQASGILGQSQALQNTISGVAGAAAQGGIFGVSDPGITPNAAGQAQVGGLLGPT